MKMHSGRVSMLLPLLYMTVVVCSFKDVQDNETSKLYYLSLEAECQAGSLTVHTRSNASNNQAVFLQPGDILRLDLCTVHNTSIRIMGVSFSVDGQETSADVLLDGLPLGDVSTFAHSNEGQFWNRFHDTGPIGSLMLLEPGTHHIDICVSSNQTQGIEIDQLYIGTTDKYTTRDILTCQLSCVSELNGPEVHEKQSNVTPATFIQRSFPTKCAEQDNVDIALLHPTVQTYRITASYPGYNSMLNYRHSDFRNCENLSPSMLWVISKKPYNGNQEVMNDIKSMEMDLDPSKPRRVKITFPLKGKSEGLIDADIGSILMVKFHEIMYDITIDLSFKGRYENVSSGKTRDLTPSRIMTLWLVPDYSWSDEKFNEIYLQINTKQKQRVVLDYISLSRRSERGEKVTTLYEDVDTALVGVNVDFWWRRPYTMNVTVDNELGQQQVFENIDYIRLRKRNPGCNSTTQLFVLYQDGNSRSLPPLIHGVNWIPFGSSVLIGPSNLTSFKPAADIRALHIQQVSPILRFQITYYDNSTALVEVCTHGLQTEVLVYDINMSGNRTDTPFVRFRSMWVTNGNCDVDHFKTNREIGRPILTEWENLESTWAKFYRSCESKHLNKSPDMSIELLQ